jgi:hypothetical protein
MANNLDDCQIEITRLNYTVKQSQRRQCLMIVSLHGGEESCHDLDFALA